MLKKFFTHSLLYSLAPQAPKIASIFLLPISTKYLTPEDYGIYGIIGSYLAIGSGVRDLGFPVVFVNTFYKYPSRWKFLWRMFHGHLFLWSLIYAVMVLGLLS